MKVNDLKVGQRAIIKEVDTNCNCILRIMTLCLVKETKIKCVKITKDNVHLMIEGAVVVISKHCASHIVV